MDNVAYGVVTADSVAAAHSRRSGQLRREPPTAVRVQCPTAGNQSRDRTRRRKAFGQLGRGKQTGNVCSRSMLLGQAAEGTPDICVGLAKGVGLKRRRHGSTGAENLCPPGARPKQSKSPVGVPKAACGQEKSRRFGHSLGEKRLAPLLVADDARCVQEQLGKSEWENVCEAQQAGMTFVLSRAVKTDGCKARDKIAEESAACSGATCQNAVVQQESSDIDLTWGGHQGDAASLKEDGVNCQGEGSRSQQVPLLHATHAVHNAAPTTREDEPLWQRSAQGAISGKEGQTAGRPADRSTQLRAFLISIRTMTLLGSSTCRFIPCLAAWTTPSLSCEVLTPT